MKKTILALLFAGSTCAAFAQVDTMNRTMGNTTATGVYDTSMSSTMGTYSNSASYNAYGNYNALAPDYVNGYVLRDYPMATDVHWLQSADWWHGYYMTNGQPSHVYYNTAGQTFSVALPVKQSLVPDAVTSRATAMWGPSVYDITTIKGTQGQDVYLVRTIDNGQLSSQWMAADGSKVIDVYRISNTDPMTNSSMNTMGNTGSQPATSTDDTTTTEAVTTTTDVTTDDMNTTSGSSKNEKMKIKTRTADGQKKVTKIVNGKATTRSGE